MIFRLCVTLQAQVFCEVNTTAFVVLCCGCPSAHTQLAWVLRPFSLSQETLVSALLGTSEKWVPSDQLDSLTSLTSLPLVWINTSAQEMWPVLVGGGWAERTDLKTHFWTWIFGVKKISERPGDIVSCTGAQPLPAGGWGWIMGISWFLEYCVGSNSWVFFFLHVAPKDRHKPNLWTSGPPLVEWA